MDSKQNTGALAILAKLAKKVIVCNAHETPETPRPTIQRIYMQDEYTSTPTTAFKCTKGRRLNFNDPKLLENLSDISEDESDYDDESVPKQGGISLYSLGQIFREWRFFGFDQPKNGKKTAKEEEEQQFDETKDYIEFLSRLSAEEMNMELM